MSFDPDPTAREIETKFGFYTVALTFTILGLAVQTASFGANIAADFAELLAWMILLISGLNGLMRLEWLPTLHQVFGLKTAADRMGYAVDHMGIDYPELRELQKRKVWDSSSASKKEARDLSAFRFITNFVRQKRRQDQ